MSRTHVVAPICPWSLIAPAANAALVPAAPGRVNPANGIPV